MHYVYVLKSEEDKNFYTGCTKDLRKRLLLHNSGNIYSTKRRKPLKLVCYEAFINQKDAFTRERWLKTGWGRNQLKKILENFLKI